MPGMHEWQNWQNDWIDRYYIKIIEYPSINKFFYLNNERIKDEDIDNIVTDLELYTLSEYQINFLIEELTKIYQSFGYNDIKIDYKCINCNHITKKSNSIIPQCNNCNLFNMMEMETP